MTAEPRAVVLLLVEVAPASRWWGWSRFVLGRWPLRHVPGLVFSKVLGSGHEGGFGLKPSASRQGLFCAFADDADAERFLAHSPVVAAYRRHARECFTVLLRVFSSRGSWSGQTFPVTTPAPDDGPIAALTRASIRPGRALRFWGHAPPSEVALDAAQGCLLSVGLGEAPLVRQATFSVWDSIESMQRYAHSGAHLAAIRASVQGGFFTESMFLRFVPTGARGDWKGRHFA